MPEVAFLAMRVGSSTEYGLIRLETMCVYNFPQYILVLRSKIAINFNVSFAIIICSMNLHGPHEFLLYAESIRL
jgi:hypothetical protein